MSTLGKKFSEETRKKMSVSQKRVGNSPLKYFSWIGKKHSLDARQKISVSASLRKRSRHSEETRKKMSEAKKGKPFSGIRFSRVGTKHTAETKLKMSKKSKGKNNSLYGKFGKEHPCWKEFKKHPFHKLIRELFKYRQWRSDIFTRDDFTCVLCTSKGVYIEADHYPKRFSEIIVEYNIKTLDEALNCEELWNINNGRTLCKNCHKKYHKLSKGKYKTL